MNSVAEFIEVRQHIESLAKEIETLIERKTTAESRARLDETAALLTKLTAMADNDVQEIAVGRLTRLVGKLTVKVAMLESHKRAVKKQPVS